jgi:predicted transcriptional regulator
VVTPKAKRKVRLSITVAPELKKLAETVADETKSTPSAVISQCLSDLAKKRKEQSMIAYYQEMAAENDECDRITSKTAEKTVAEWND